MNIKTKKIKIVWREHFSFIHVGHKGVLNYVYCFNIVSDWGQLCRKRVFVHLPFLWKIYKPAKKVCKINRQTFLTIYIHSRKLITKTKTALHFTRKTFETHIPGSPDWPPGKKIKKQRKIQKIIYWLVDKIIKKKDFAYICESERS